MSMISPFTLIFSPLISGGFSAALSSARKPKADSAATNVSANNADNLVFMCFPPTGFYRDSRNKRDFERDSLLAAGVLHCGFELLGILLAVECLRDLAVRPYHDCHGHAFEAVVFAELFRDDRNVVRDFISL